MQREEGGVMMDPKTTKGVQRVLLVERRWITDLSETGRELR